MTTPRSATHTNPYTADGRADNYGLAVAAGADPIHYSDAATPAGAAGRWDNGGWSPRITRDDYAGVTDPTRVEELPRHDARPNLRNPWGWWARRDAETSHRESVTHTDANGMQEGKGHRGIGPDPRWTPPPEPRPTQALNPHNYFFTRPFQQDTARRLTGAHVSLANNRRMYQILTMSPVPVRRNTYRVTPSPWDTDIVDEAPDPTTGRPDMRLQQPPITSATIGRSYRLD